MIIYFYKVEEPYGCFSNFSPHEIFLGGQNWLTVEHYYQAHKFVGSVDRRLVAAIRGVATPQEAAQLGRDPNHRIRDDWEAVKIPIMREAILTKFLAHRDIQAILLGTGERVIVEDSPTDYYWGCGCEGTGQNHLGKILMSVRHEIGQRLGG
ncbi:MULTISPECIES: NADAR family protein [unclassified Microcoleus]|uniref:NADAR family protein n=1 Tax=unclassified Microcoleus TaxID=2642155 RepID=UPI002FD3DBEF